MRPGGLAFVLAIAFGGAPGVGAPAPEEETQDGSPGAPERVAVPEPPLPVWAPSDAGRLRDASPWLARELLPAEVLQDAEGLFVVEGLVRGAEDEDGFFRTLGTEETGFYQRGGWVGGLLDPRGLLEEAVRTGLRRRLEEWSGRTAHGLGLVVLDQGEILPGSEEWKRIWKPAFASRPSVVAIYSLDSPGLSRLLLLNARAGSLAAVDLIGLRAAALGAARQRGSRVGGIEGFVEELGRGLHAWEIDRTERRLAARSEAAERLARLGGAWPQWAVWILLAAVGLTGILLAIYRGCTPGRWRALRGLEGVNPAAQRFGGLHAGGAGAQLRFNSKEARPSKAGEPV
ncbi:MAG TPA: hypothetical protein VMN36_17055 [Verrucomicrobiales bacterium]|nr:hypothetical protein [Verrucomicrobiales bacterium]